MASKFVVILDLVISDSLRATLQEDFGHTPAMV